MADKRFGKLRKDPRFRDIPQKIHKVKIDPRFESMMTDPKFSITGEINEYGEKMHSTTNKELEKYYIHDKTQQSDEEHPFEWNEQSSSEEIEGIEKDEEPDVWEEVHEKPIVSDHTSKILAIQNLDWSQITAKDIYMLCSSIANEKGKILKVTIYLSNYGKKMIELEKEGPPDALQIDQSAPKKEELKLLKLKDIENFEEKDVADPASLRRYELNKLKYYYAIVDCSTKELAEHIYNELNDFELELSSMKLDLRFVGEDIKLPEEPKEVCISLPLDYEPKYTLFNRALQHTDVKLTWESNEDQRNKLQKCMKKLMDDKLDEADINEIVAVEGESDDNEIICPKCTKESICDKCKESIASRKSQLENESREKYKPLLKNSSENECFGGKNKDKKAKGKRVNVGFKSALENPAKRKELELLVEDPKPEFKLNVEDSRFNGLYNDSRYSIDPTYKDYKKANKVIIKEQIKRKKKNIN